MTYALCYIQLEPDDKPTCFCLLDFENRYYYGGKNGSLQRAFGAGRRRLYPDEIANYLNSKNNVFKMISLTREQFGKFLQFSVNAFEGKDPKKTFKRFGLAEWLI